MSSCQCPHRREVMFSFLTILIYHGVTLLVNMNFLLKENLT